MGPTQFAQTAARYWWTYRPSALAQIPEQDREEFFARVGQEAADLAEELTWQIKDESPRLTDAAARLRAEDEALRELIYLEKEPGTQDREMPRSR
jgi:hypothetical protein